MYQNFQVPDDLALRDYSSTPQALLPEPLTASDSFVEEFLQRHPRFQVLRSTLSREERPVLVPPFTRAQIGNGHYGHVYLGRITKEDGKTIKVAMKMNEEEDIAREEANSLARICHNANVLALLGVFSEHYKSVEGVKAGTLEYG